MERTGCVVAGGGPAGMMLGLLLARAGVEVTVLEKHGDFLRDFRGDTVHASTIRLIDELGLGAEFRRLPQSRLRNVTFPVAGAGEITVGDFGALRPPYNYVAMMPQWDFLAFLAKAAAQEPTFTLLMDHAVTGLLREGGKVTGVRYSAPGKPTGSLAADLVVACDGRHSLLRQHAGLVPKVFAVPFDIWWFRLPRDGSEGPGTSGVVPTLGTGEALVSLFRDDYFQLGYLAFKADAGRIESEGIEGFRRRIGRLRPDLAARTDALRSLDDLHRLDVRVDRLRRWYTDGLLCIGDAAHAMSPVGGVGINLAIQDAVATAAVLAPALLRGRVGARDLAKVVRRRRPPAVVVQTAQRIIHRALLVPVLRGKRLGVPRPLLFLVRHIPATRKLAPRLIAFGPRPEHAPAFARRPERPSPTA
ncbi:MAG TPA: FAD-dependent oxidoreductase [Arthrobacter sp.]|nr:FAD-dependent oxidoreductase [Arthrobacter sp.]